MKYKKEGKRENLPQCRYQTAHKILIFRRKNTNLSKKTKVN